MGRRNSSNLGKKRQKNSYSNQGKSYNGYGSYNGWNDYDEAFEDEYIEAEHSYYNEKFRDKEKIIKKKELIPKDLEIEEIQPLRKPKEKREMMKDF